MFKVLGGYGKPRKVGTVVMRGVFLCESGGGVGGGGIPGGLVPSGVKRGNVSNGSSLRREELLDIYDSSI